MLQIISSIKWVLILTIVSPAFIYGGIKANEYRQSQIIFQEAKQLLSAGKYQEAISKLVVTEDKWAPEGLKKEINLAIEESKLLAESSENYELGKEVFENEDYNEALEILRKVDSRNTNYSKARSLIELAEKNIENPKREVAGVKTENKVVKSALEPPPVPTETILNTPSLIPSPQPSIDWGKVAELKNILGAFKRQANIMALAEFQIKFNQDGLSACLRGVEQTINDAPIVAGSKLNFSPTQINEMENNCTNLYQQKISSQTSIYNAALNQIQLDKDRANVLVAECPKCWEEAQK